LELAQRGVGDHDSPISHAGQSHGGEHGDDRIAVGVGLGSCPSRSEGCSSVDAS
jgi:hypothetical protein